MKQLGAVACTVLALSFAVGSIFAGQAGGVLFLGHSEGDSTPIPLLQREIMRQAAALALREDGDFLCRDLVLGAPDGMEAAHRLETATTLDGSGKVAISLRDPDSARLVWSGKFDGSDYAQLLAEVERAATEGLAPQASTPAKTGDAAALPDAKLVDSARLSDLFEALRGAHALHRQTPSPETYDLLVRGYAHLGLRSSHLWSCAYKTYQARALVYAQRFVRTHPDEASAYFLRAYAFGLCGLHAEALADIGRGKDRADGSPPEWLQSLELFLRFDIDRLVELANSESAQNETAALLAMVSLEFSPFDSRIVDVAARIETPIPVELRTVMQLNGIGGLTVLRNNTKRGFAQMGLWVTQELPGHPLLPERVGSQYAASVEKTLEAKMGYVPPMQGCGMSTATWPELDYVPQLYRVLGAETASGRDLDEPSLAAFGHLLRENMFVVALWRQYFMDECWSVDIDDYTQSILPYVEGHPYQCLLEAFSAKRHVSRAQYRTLLGQLEPASLPAGAYLFFDELVELRTRYGTQTGSQMRERYLAECDRTYPDLQRIYELQDDKGKKAAVAQQLLATSPNSPLGQRYILLYAKNWETLGKEYAARGSMAPETSQIIAYKYRKARRYKEAIPYYEKALEQISEIFVYERLAKCYLRTGDKEKWLLNMEKALLQPDTGLEHADTCCEISRRLLDWGQIEKARSYADRAAETGSQWAMSLAGECAFADGDIERAQELLRAEKRRYLKNQLPLNEYWRAVIYALPEKDDWGEAIENELASSQSVYGETDLEMADMAFFLWRRGDLDRAIVQFDAALSEKPDVWYDLAKALVQLEKGDRSAYLQTLDGIGSASPRDSSRKQIRRLAIAMKKYALERPDADKVYRELTAQKKQGALYAADFYFFAGKYLALMGYEDEAIQFFFKGIAPKQIDRMVGPFSYLELMDRGLDPLARYTGGIPAYPPVD